VEEIAALINVLCGELFCGLGVIAEKIAFQ
jgi:hypothetical protein